MKGLGEELVLFLRAQPPKAVSPIQHLTGGPRSDVLIPSPLRILTYARALSIHSRIPFASAICSPGAELASLQLDYPRLQVSVYQLPSIHISLTILDSSVLAILFSASYLRIRTAAHIDRHHPASSGWRAFFWHQVDLCGAPHGAARLN